MKTSRWILSAILSAILIVGFCPSFAIGDEPAGDAQKALSITVASSDSGVVAKSTDPCYKMTPSLVTAAYDYLSEVYTKKYPKMALRRVYGTDKDRENLKQLADAITKGLKTDREKVAAVIDWCLDSIEYVGPGNATPTDVFYDRKASKLGFATLAVELLRSEGIPAVWADGWRGDMRKLTHKILHSDTMDDHTWFLAYLDGKWTMYDPLCTGARQITDREYIASWYYFGTVEGVGVSYPGMDLSLVGNGIAVIYKDGRFLLIDGGKPFGPCNASWYLNGLSIDVTAYSEGTPYHYADSSRTTSGMVEGELFRDGWFGCNYAAHEYAFENGVKPHATILNNGEAKYFFSQGCSYRILAPDDTYWIKWGLFTVASGFSGKTLLNTWLEDYEGIPGYKITYQVLDSESKKTGEMKSDGTFTALSPGVFNVQIECTQLEDNENVFSEIMSILVSEERKDLSKAVVSFAKNSYAYTGKDQKPAVTVRLGGVTLEANTDYSVTYGNNKNIGTATAMIIGKDSYTGLIGTFFNIVKAKNTITVKAKSPTVKASKVKKASQSIAAKKAFTVSKANGKVSYKKVSGNKKIKVSSKGKITVKKGLKKGTYKVRVKVSATGDANYKAGSKTVTVKVKVR